MGNGLVSWLYYVQTSTVIWDMGVLPSSVSNELYTEYQQAGTI